MKRCGTFKIGRMELRSLWWTRVLLYNFNRGLKDNFIKDNFIEAHDLLTSCEQERAALQNQREELKDALDKAEKRSWKASEKYEEAKGKVRQMYAWKEEWSVMLREHGILRICEKLDVLTSRGQELSECGRLSNWLWRYLKVLFSGWRSIMNEDRDDFARFSLALGSYCSVFDYCLILGS